MKFNEADEINKVLDFENSIIEKCKNRLYKFHQKAEALGIELKIVLEQNRYIIDVWADPYPLEEKGKLPRYYHSNINVNVYKEGVLLKKIWDENILIQFFGLRLSIVDGPKRKLMFFEDCLQDFDISMEGLLTEIQEYLPIMDKTSS